MAKSKQVQAKVSHPSQDVSTLIAKLDDLANELVDGATPLFEVGEAAAIVPRIDAYRKSFARGGFKHLSGTYIWRVACSPKPFIETWWRRVEWYETCRLRNRDDSTLRILSEPREPGAPHELLKFQLPIPNPRWLELHEPLQDEPGEFVLYVGKRNGGALLTRLKQHAKCDPGTGALKLCGTREGGILETRKQKEFMDEFLRQDRELVAKLPYTALKCNAVFLGQFDAHATQLLENLLRKVLNPMLGTK